MATPKIPETPYLATPETPCCPRAVHDVLIADPAAFAMLEEGGYQEVEALGMESPDVLELRYCELCYSPLARRIGAPIRAMLARARREDDLAMIAYCREALRGNATVIEAFRMGTELGSVVMGAAQ